uniref:G_PROTEIN_RECEP_F1_2 domain-containing protein n=2 Tax=Bursaphelenchus xylophilus TaxID=6326 RepID=A0A1I7SCS5_BURXY
MHSCRDERFFVGALYSIFMLPCLVLQALVVKYIVLVYLTCFFSIEPYGLVLTLSRINIIAMKSVIPEVALKTLNRLTFPGYLLVMTVITVFPSADCGLFYYAYNWETASDCAHQDMLNGLTEAVYVILGFNLMAYFVISGFLAFQRRQTQASSSQTDFKAEQRVLLSTMSSFFSTFVLITGKLAVTVYVNDVVLARVVYRVLVLICNNLFAFSLVFVNT